MKSFTVVIETKGREVYYVGAESEAEARDTWMDFPMSISEVTDAWVASVVED